MSRRWDYKGGGEWGFAEYITKVNFSKADNRKQI